MDWITTSMLPRTGLSEIDDAHVKLAGLVNQLADAMENNEAKERCDDLLDEFIAQVTRHFALEDRLMHDKHYPLTDGHQATHAALIRDVLSFKASYDAGAIAQNATLLSILDSWLKRDILDADKHLAAFIAGEDPRP
jgi:hemerythrin-like metal-binding protein